MNIIDRQEIITVEGSHIPLEIFHEPLAYGARVTRFELADDIGHLRGEFFERNGSYDIAVLTVNPNMVGLGIGKALLRHALHDAEHQRATRVIGTLISPECVSAMRSVFGEKALETRTGSTATWLNYPLLT